VSSRKNLSWHVRGIINLGRILIEGGVSDRWYLPGCQSVYIHSDELFIKYYWVFPWMARLAGKRF